MTKQDADELGRRALACKHWRWMPGMQASLRITLDGKPYERCVRVVNAEGRSFLGATPKPGKRASVTRFMKSWGIVRHVQAGPVEKEDFIPDLDDPATLGCLLALVREAWPDEWHEFMVPIFDGFSHWRVGCLQLERLPGAPQVIVPINQETMKPLVWAYTEAEALVVALEAAP